MRAAVCGYMAKLETVRPSGVPDEVTVVFAEDVPYRACNGIEFDVMQEFVEGSRLLLTGKVQTLKDFRAVDCWYIFWQILWRYRKRQ